MVQSAEKFKVVSPDSCIYCYHAVTVGADGRINENTVYSDYYWDKTAVERLVAVDT